MDEQMGGWMYQWMDEQTEEEYITYMCSTETFRCTFILSHGSFEWYSLSLIQVFIWFPPVLSKLPLISHKFKTNVISPKQSPPTESRLYYVLMRGRLCTRHRRDI